MDRESWIFIIVGTCAVVALAFLAHRYRATLRAQWQRLVRPTTADADAYSWAFLTPPPSLPSISRHGAYLSPTNTTPPPPKTTPPASAKTPSECEYVQMTELDLVDEQRRFEQTFQVV